MTSNNESAFQNTIRTELNDFLIEIIANFTKLKMEIYNVFSLKKTTERDARTIMVDDFMWDYFHHGKEEICFRRQTRHRITIDIIDQNEWRAFDVWTLKAYIGTMKKKCAEEHEIARLSRDGLLQYLLKLCEQSDFGVKRYCRNMNEFIFYTD